MVKCITYVSPALWPWNKTDIITEVNKKFQSTIIINYTETKPTLPNNTWLENESKLKLCTTQKLTIRQMQHIWTYNKTRVIYRENKLHLLHLLDFSGNSDGKESACNAWLLVSIPGSGRSPREGNDYPLQYSCLGNPMDREAWQAIVHGLQRVRHDWVTKHEPVTTFIRNEK